MTSVLDQIESPADLRLLPPQRLQEVVDALRAEIIEVISNTGGHLAASLGAVELATVLHYVFDTPADRLIWDVGHQGYPHKMLTGRRKQFPSIGQKDGIGKFLRREESPFDVFGAGHAGTSISAATGIAEAIRRRGARDRVIAVIGDGALTAGMAYEGLNNAGYMGLSNLVVVLNDNEMSISPNVGAMSSYLSRRWSGPLIRRVKRGIRQMLESLPGPGDDLLHLVRRAEQSFKVFISPAFLFEGLGFNYIGPIDGHDLPALIETFTNVRDMQERHEPVLPERVKEFRRVTEQLYNDGMFDTNYVWFAMRFAWCISLLVLGLFVASRGSTPYVILGALITVPNIFIIFFIFRQFYFSPSSLGNKFSYLCKTSSSKIFPFSEILYL